VIAVNSNTSF